MSAFDQLCRLLQIETGSTITHYQIETTYMIFLFANGEVRTV